jgi:hypothetical protein
MSGLPLGWEKHVSKSTGKLKLIKDQKKKD